jgi:hypothetical protein
LTNSTVSACNSVTYWIWSPHRHTLSFTNLPITEAADPACHRLRSTAQPLGRDAAAAYTCTLSLVGKLLADLHSGERVKNKAVFALLVSY